ncbi:MAG: hypothetical protein ACTSU5_08575 [Promethearchaeota archaeon]
MTFVPNYLLKRVFPENSFSTVDLTGDGKADALQIQGINIISPISVPEHVDLGDFNIDDVGKVASIEVDGKPVKFTKDDLLNGLVLWHGGRGYTFRDIMDGKAKGVTIAMGDKLILHFKFEGVAELGPGTHELKVAWDDGSGEPTVITLTREISAANLNVPFDPGTT